MCKKFITFYKFFPTSEVQYNTVNDVDENNFSVAKKKLIFAYKYG